MNHSGGHDAGSPNIPRSQALLSQSLRGALAGLAVLGTMYLALEYAFSVVDGHPASDGVAALGATMIVWLEVGVPISFLVGLAVAWATRLQRPWLVSFMGLLHTGLLACGFGYVEHLLRPVPGWALPSGLVILGYAAAAVLVVNSARVSPGGTSSATSSMAG